MFETDFGSGIAKALFQTLRGKKILFVTQENLLQKYRALIPAEFVVQCIDNMEEEYLAGLNERIARVDEVV